MSTVELVLPKGHKDLEITAAMEREMNDVQRELEGKGNDLQQGVIHFMITKGIYQHDRGVLRLASVIINRTSQDIIGLEMDLQIGLRKQPDAKFAKMTLNLDEEFLGVIKSNEAFILHMNIPAENVAEGDKTFEPSEITGEVDNLKYFINQT